MPVMYDQMGPEQPNPGVVIRCKGCRRGGVGSGDGPGPPGSLTGPTCQSVDPAFMATMPRSIALAI